MPIVDKIPDSISGPIGRVRLIFDIFSKMLVLMTVLHDRI